MGLMDKVGNFLQGDFVKNGVKEMLIARPDDNADLIWKHPDRSIPMFAQCTVRADEWAVFSKEGRPAGTLAPGRTSLSTQNIPFLSNFVDQYTGGNIFMTDLFFVKQTPVEMKFGGSLGNILDPLTQIRVKGRCHGSLLLKVENPEILIYQYFGMRKFQDHPDIFDWFKDAFFTTVKSTIGRFAKDERKTILDIMGDSDALAQAFVQNASELAACGMRVSKVTKFEVDVPEEDIKRFDEANAKIAEARRGLVLGEIGIQQAALAAQAQAAGTLINVQTAQYAAQANQFALDQKLRQDQAYLQAVGANPQAAQALGQLEAMRGAGAGLAQGGGNTGLTGLGAQVAAGAVVGTGIAGAMGGFGGMGGGAAPAAMAGMAGAAMGAVAGGGAAANLVSCHACNARVPPGKFCAECGTTLAPQKKKCTGCGVDLQAGSKFCAECGTPANAPAAQ